MESGEYDIDALDETANSTLKTLGADYSAKTVYRTRFVPEKQYKNLALPEGIYRCIDVVLGEGNGENWWCVAYPPLCFTEAVVGELSGDAKKELKSILSDEAFDTVLKDGEITYKFKILETYQKIKGWIR